VIHVNGFHKAYRNVVAVEGLDFEVNPGEILGLVGPNGAGKTTTLRALTGIIPPTQGTLSVAGFDLAKDPVEAKRRMAYIPDDPKLFDALTTWEHLQFIGAAYQVDGFAEKGARLLDQFELTEKRDTIAQELSRGMQQKVAICCAYLHDPKVILFDEPLTGLDPRAIRTLKQSIIERAQAGGSIIISSHLLALVENLCSHLLILHRGKQMFWGSVQEARSAFADMDADTTLEEVFFRMTEGPEQTEENPAVNP